MIKYGPLYWLSNVEPALYSQDKLSLIVIYYFSIHCCIWLAPMFLRDNSLQFSCTILYDLNRRVILPSYNELGIDPIFLSLKKLWGIGIISPLCLVKFASEKTASEVCPFGSYLFVYLFFPINSIILNMQKTIQVIYLLLCFSFGNLYLSRNWFTSLIMTFMFID